MQRNETEHLCIPITWIIYYATSVQKREEINLKLLKLSKTIRLQGYGVNYFDYCAIRRQNIFKLEYLIYIYEEFRH